MSSTPVKHNPNKCGEHVSDHTGFYWFQCSRKPGHGPEARYCKQHAKKLVERMERQRRNEERTS